MKNKKGFTLVELLAVIVVLALLALLAGNAVGNMLDKSRWNTMRTDALTIARAAEDKYNLDSLEGSLPTAEADGSYKYTCAALVSGAALDQYNQDYTTCEIKVKKESTGKLTTTINIQGGAYKVVNKTKDAVSGAEFGDTGSSVVIEKK